MKCDPKKYQLFVSPRPDKEQEANKLVCQMLIERGKDPDDELASVSLNGIVYSTYEIDCRIGQELARAAKGRGDIEMVFIKRHRTTRTTTLVKIPQLFDDASEGRKIANSIRTRRAAHQGGGAERTRV